MTNQLKIKAGVDLNQNGQTMGRKGMQTRRRLIDATLAQLETTRLRDLRVSDIAREAGTSAATFYVYFPDVSDAVLAALEELTQSAPELLAIVNEDWSEGDPEVRARRIVDSYAQIWYQHEPLLRVRNLAADEGDNRFRLAREKAIRGMLAASADAIRRAQAAGWVFSELEPVAAAGVLMAMLERFAAVRLMQRNGFPEQMNMDRAAAHMVASMMGPPAR